MLAKSESGREGKYYLRYGRRTQDSSPVMIGSSGIKGSRPLAREDCLLMQPELHRDSQAGR